MIRRLGQWLRSLNIFAAFGGYAGLDRPGASSMGDVIPAAERAAIYWIGSPGNRRPKRSTSCGMLLGSISIP